MKHWHGAAPNAAMTHIAIVENLNGRSADWMENVSDAQYGAPPRAAEASTARTSRLALQNGLTREELIEAITHLAFYTGWPNAVSAVGVAREVFQQR